MTVRVEVHVIGAGISRMMDMRVWLDARRFEPDLFRHEATPDGLKIVVDFKFRNEAAAFADAFGGRLIDE